MADRMDAKAVLADWRKWHPGVPLLGGRKADDVLANALQQTLTDLEAAGCNHIERKHIDATPNEGYPIRILRIYRADCDMRWADTSDGDVGNPLMVALNEMQDKRAVILDWAIAALAGEEKK